ncbi:MAG: pyruvate dehydrogenase (acetyl-transferring), homodimeric type, partial [Gammaproteobacteria bacterium]|nr:pyruvate dehydrogenase (acetyl-transferring), homodimeric type [Gammaproteobacteria bacterium]
MSEESRTPDVDPVETSEWQESIQAVVERHGHERANFLLGATSRKAYEIGTPLPVNANTPYLNTIPAAREPATPGDDALEWRIRTLNRWNAMATVVRANRVTTEYGGHIASFASSAVLYDMGLNHFWRAPTDDDRGDLVFFQGHAIPGIYARAFMEGRISEEQLLRFRAEVDGDGLSSYPHPWLMPDFWQFPTVSMGLGPIMAIYQARFMKYLHHREILDAGDRKVWAFLGDGETDEPESLGAISLAGRE